MNFQRRVYRMMRIEYGRLKKQMSLSWDLEFSDSHRVSNERLLKEAEQAFTSTAREIIASLAKGEPTSSCDIKLQPLERHWDELNSLRADAMASVLKSPKVDQKKFAEKLLVDIEWYAVYSQAHINFHAPDCSVPNWIKSMETAASSNPSYDLRAQLFERTIANFQISVARPLHRPRDMDFSQFVFQSYTKYFYAVVKAHIVDMTVQRNICEKFVNKVYNPMQLFGKDIGNLMLTVNARLGHRAPLIYEDERRHFSQPSVDHISVVHINQILQNRANDIYGGAVAIQMKVIRNKKLPNFDIIQIPNFKALEAVIKRSYPQTEKLVRREGSATAWTANDEQFFATIRLISHAVIINRTFTCCSLPLLHRTKAMLNFRRFLTVESIIFGDSR